MREYDVVAEGVRAPVIDAGPEGADEAVLFLHGHPGCGRDWSGLLEPVGEFARAVAVDLPGFGRADKPRDFGYRVERYATWIDAMRHELGLRRLHLVMHDFGGPFGLIWAAMNRDDFASAVLINTGFMRGLRWHRMARMWRKPLLGELLMLAATKRAFTRGLSQGSPSGLPPEFLERTWEEWDRHTRRAVLELYRATGPPDRLAELLAPAFAELDRPALVVWGAGDPFLPVEYAHGNKEAFPSAEIVVLDSGHWPWLDQPEAAAAAILPFLRRQLAGG
jgi:pimeloyl-ACP methyl ester carboxylesterase